MGSVAADAFCGGAEMPCSWIMARDWTRANCCRGRAWPMPDEAEETAAWHCPQRQGLGFSLRFQPLGAPRPLDPHRAFGRTLFNLSHGYESWGLGHGSQKQTWQTKEDNWQVVR